MWGQGEREKDGEGGMEVRDGAGRVRRGPGGAGAWGLWHWGHSRTHGGCRRHWWGAGVRDAGNSTFPRSPNLHGASWGHRGGCEGWEERRKRTLASCCPSLGGPPARCPQWLSPTATLALQGPAHGGCQGGTLVKPAAAKPQSRVWGLTRREAPAYPRGPRAEWDSSPRAPQSWGVPAVPSLWGQTRTSAGVSTAAPLPQPRCSSIPGASSPCPALGRLCGAGRTLTPPALARGNSWHEGAGQGTWLRDDGATPDAFPPGRRNRKHFLIGEPNKPQNNNQRKEERKNQRKPFGEEEFLFH